MAETADVDDRAVVGQVIAGDLDAFAVLVRRYQRRLYWYLAGLLPEEAIVEDVVQQSFIVCYRRLRDYDTARPFFAWLRGIAQNCCRNQWRSLRRDARLRERLVDELRSEWHLRHLEAEPDESHDERLTALRRCLGELDERQRRLIRLRFCEEWDLEALGEALGRSADAARLTLFRLRRRLAACIGRRLSGSEEGP